MSTPHNRAEKGEIAKTVLMPGDPLRAKYIAEKYLEDAKLVNDVRGMYAYTGKYHDKELTVMASGMGMPSMGIYSYELFNEYDADSIIRIGTAGAISEKLGLRDVVLGLASCTGSTYAKQFGLPFTPVAAASYELLRRADDCAAELGMQVHVGTLLCTDIATEMESAALYYNAARAGKKALCICTISDCPLTGLSCSAQERQTTFEDMVKIALGTV